MFSSEPSVAKIPLCHVQANVKVGHVAIAAFRHGKRELPAAALEDAIPGSGAVFLMRCGWRPAAPPSLPSFTLATTAVPHPTTCHSRECGRGSNKQKGQEQK